MGISITTLSENTAGLGMVAEWGLSVLVETDSLSVLFDAGAGESTVRNAGILGKDLSKVNTIAISHGHYDHTGGLRDVLRRTGQVEVIAHPDIWDAKYGGSGDNARYAGIPFRREELEGLGAWFNLSKQPVKIGDDITTTGEVPMVTGYEQVEPYLFVKKGEQFLPDTLADDLSIIINTEQGLVVILGCAHRGMINHIRHAQMLFPGQPIDTVIGGSHLLHASPERMALTIGDLKEIGVRRLGLSHCTGFGPSAQLASEFGEIFFPNNAGTQITLP
ncbi:MBL fold metallo-hydrolase [Chloroflexota bacterium]